MFPEARAHDLVVAHLSSHMTHVADFYDASLSHVDHAELDDVSFSMDAKDVLVDIAHCHDALGFSHLRDSFDLVAIDRCDLELHVLRRRAHALFKLARELVVPPEQK